MTLVWLLVVLTAIPLLGAVLPRLMGRAAGWPLGAGFLIAAVVGWPSARDLLNQGPGGAVEWSTPWVPEFGVHIALRLDGLSLVFIALALLVGAVVFFYSTTYFTKGDQRGFYVIMSGFTVAMVAFVLSDDLVLMFLTWELTSLASFLLIARSGHAGEPASMRTMLLTFIGGLCLLSAVAVTIAQTGTTRFSEAVSSPVWGEDPLITSVVAVLVALAGFSKAAQFPFHLWLPDAMAAATPVSAYLHAAAVVKAGIYLLFRFTSIFHGTLIWNVLLIGAGLFTAVMAAFFALQQTDLKKLMAYSTVSQLGLITATIGIGTEFAIGAAVLHTIAHACFKSGLFMLVGVIDHQAGTRSISRLPALRSAMPVTFGAVVIGAASMAGAPPMLGFISKENIFAAMLDAPGPAWVGPVLLAVAAVGAVLTFAYCGKIVTGAFLDGGAPKKPIREARAITLIPAALPVLVGVPLAFVANQFEGPVELAVVSSHPVTEHNASFTLWHGISLELIVTVLVFLVGTALVLRRGVLRSRVERPLLSKDGAQVIAALTRRLYRVGAALGEVVRRDHASRHIVPIAISLAAALGLGSLALWSLGVVDPLIPGASSAVDLGVFAVVAGSVIALTRTYSRVGATVLLGGIGIALTVQIFLLGAADVGLTLLLVEVLTVLVIMLVLRKLPLEFGRPRPKVGTAKAVIAVASGAAAALAAYTVMGRRERSDVAQWYLANAADVTGGDNIVNVILVELRALDTFGELAVLGMAGLAIVAVLATIPRAFFDPEPDPDPQSPVTYVPRPQIDVDEKGSRAYRALEDSQANTEPLRLLQRPLVPVLIAISAVLFWRGHNQPGGGFIAALVAACAVAYIYMAKDKDAPVSRPGLPVVLIAGGILVALATGLWGYAASPSGEFLQPVYVTVFGTKFASSMLFDVGVYTAVLGLVMVAFNVLGSDDGVGLGKRVRPGPGPTPATGPVPQAEPTRATGPTRATAPTQATGPVPEGSER